MDAAGSNSTKLSQSSSKRLRGRSSLELLVLGALLTCSGLTGVGSRQFAKESRITNEQHPQAVGHTATSWDMGMNRA